jgi:chaperonin GroEL
LYPPLELCLRNKVAALVIVAARLSDAAIGFLAGNRKPDQFQVMAVKTPGWDKVQKAAALEDMVALAGGRPFIQVAGDTFERFKLEDLGHERRAWADLRTFGIVGGSGDPRALRKHIGILRAAYNQSDEPVLRDALLSRIGKLLGGSATLWIGAATEMDIKARQELAERTAATVRGAMMEGAVPGGGVALLACRQVLQRRLAEATDPDERAAFRLLLRAAAEPFRAITGNAGYDPSEVLAELKHAGPRCGFDVVAGRVVNVEEQGLYDAAGVLKAAVYGAISTAALALTVDVLIHRREQPKHAQVHVPEKRKRL